VLGSTALMLRSSTISVHLEGDRAQVIVREVDAAREQRGVLDLARGGVRRLVAEVLAHVVGARVVEPHVVMESTRSIDDVVTDVLHVVHGQAVDPLDRGRPVEQRQELVLTVGAVERGAAGRERLLELVEDDEALVEGLEEVDDALGILADENDGNVALDRASGQHAQEHRLALALVAREHHAEVAFEARVGAEDLVDLGLAAAIDLLRTHAEVLGTQEAEALLDAVSHPVGTEGEGIVSLDAGVVDPNLSAGFDVGTAHCVGLLRGKRRAGGPISV